jgi:hypothetical protein
MGEQARSTDRYRLLASQTQRESLGCYLRSPFRRDHSPIREPYICQSQVGRY